LPEVTIAKESKLEARAAQAAGLATSLVAENFRRCLAILTVLAVAKERNIEGRFREAKV
jgi:hypothetical protein